jgi:hypothetical protein
MTRPFDRRSFLSASLGAAGLLAASPRLIGQEQAAAAVPEILFLTWDRDPTTTMTIVWLGRDRKTPSAAVRYRTHDPKAEAIWQSSPVSITTKFPVFETMKMREEAAKAAKKTAEPLGPNDPQFTGPTDYVVQRVALTGLSPGMEYEFTIGDSAKVHRFRTMPAKATDSFHFVSGGDSGVNVHALNNNRLAAAQDPMFVMIGGDLGYDNGVSGSTALNFIRNYSMTMTDTKGRLIPLVTCLGNHEVRGGYNKTLKEATFFTPLFGGLYPEKSYATLDFGDYLSLVLTDSGHCAKITGEQTEWLRGALKERTGKDHLIPINHVPCYPSFREPKALAKDKFGTGEEQRKEWCPLFEQFGVDIVLEHHDHTFKRTQPLTGGQVDRATGITYLGDGSWGHLRVPKNPEKRNYLQVVNEAYHFTLHRLEGEQRFHVALGETGKVLDVYRTGKRPRHRTPGVTTG